MIRNVLAGSGCRLGSGFWKGKRMNIFRYDSPLMVFISTVTDIVILNVLCLICCIPIVTIGPALTAKYTVAMRIVRKEHPAIFKPFFEAFVENLKQSLIIWGILLVACLLVWLDWSWMIDQGFLNVPAVYFGAAVFITMILSFIIMTIFPIISRFRVTVGEAFKVSALFSMLYFFALIAINFLMLFSIYACIRWFRWLPLVLVISHTTIVFCLCLTLQRGFKKLEARFGINQDQETPEALEEMARASIQPEVEHSDIREIAEAKKQKQDNALKKKAAKKPEVEEKT